MRSIILDGKTYSDDSLPFVIAEIGHNHQGDLDTALKMIRAAKDSGASAVKLQKRKNSDLFTPDFFNSPYVSENAYGETYGLHREALELSEDEYLACQREAEKCGITFFATAFDFASAEFLNEIGVPLFKVASGDLTNHPLLEKLAAFKKPIILSTGGATIADIDAATRVLQAGKANFALLQCTAGYPPAPEEANLRVIEKLRADYPEIVVGYSGHDSGVIYSVVAYVLGARIIEKHFTLDRTMKGTDHAFSLEPRGMKKMTDEFVSVGKALGNGIKIRYPSEEGPLRKMGKMIVASRNLTAGTVIEKSHLEFRSPADGLSPAELRNVLGKTLNKNLEAYKPLLADDLL